MPIDRPIVGHFSEDVWLSVNEAAEVLGVHPSTLIAHSDRYDAWLKPTMTAWRGMTQRRYRESRVQALAAERERHAAALDALAAEFK